AGNWRRGGGMLTGQRVEQAGFSDIRSSDQRNIKTFTDPLAAFKGAQELFDFGSDFPAARNRFLFFHERIMLLFAEIDISFHSRHQLKKKRSQFFEAPAQSSIELLQSKLGLGQGI